MEPPKYETPRSAIFTKNIMNHKRSLKDMEVPPHGTFKHCKFSKKGAQQSSCRQELTPKLTPKLTIRWEAFPNISFACFKDNLRLKKSGDMINEQILKTIQGMLRAIFTKILTLKLPGESKKTFYLMKHE